MVCKQMPAPEESSQLLSAWTKTGDEINQELFSRCVKEKGEMVSLTHNLQIKTTL